MPEVPFPAVPKALIETLERIYPNRVPTIDATDRAVWSSVGVQQVITKLRSEYNRQNQPQKET